LEGSKLKRILEQQCENCRCSCPYEGREGKRCHIYMQKGARGRDIGLFRCVSGEAEGETLWVTGKAPAGDQFGAGGLEMKGGRGEAVSVRMCLYQGKVSQRFSICLPVNSAKGTKHKRR